MRKTNSSVYRPFFIVLAIVLLVLILDQWLKFYIKTNFAMGEIRPLFGDWLVLEYIENQGMAFGTSFGSSIWAKLALSIFRIVAITGIIYYWITQSRQGARFEFQLALGFILAGAMGNLIDSMFYDFLFPYDPCFPYNHLRGSGNLVNCEFYGQIETKHEGFLLGNVVDMFKFHGYWPDWMPLIGGADLFPAIWNLADGSITVGVVMVFIRQKTYFPQTAKTKTSTQNIAEEIHNPEE